MEDIIEHKDDHAQKREEFLAKIKENNGMFIWTDVSSIEEKTEHKEVEIRSEELQEVMGKTPPWILRSGISVLFIVFLAIIIGSGFFKYPDVIISDMTLTGRYPVAQIVARSSGKISKLYISDGQEVKANKVLAVIENPASIDDVLFLKHLLKDKSNPDSMRSVMKYKTISTTELSLGEMQSSYTSFLNSLNDYDNYYSLNYYEKKIKALKSQINKYRTYFENQKSRQIVMEEQHKLAILQYSRDSSLFKNGIISPSDLDNAMSSYLQSKYSLDNGYAALENLSIQIGEMENNLLDMELQQAEKKILLLHSYNTSIEQLINVINNWELNYCLTTPIEGKITFLKYWHENQFVQGGETVFSIIPEEKEELIGKALLPIARSGKVKTGQRVIIRFANYPDQEFGIVNGIVSSISLVPQENNYQISITLPDGLITNYGETLPITYEMKASAEIVTENLSLLERFFMPMRKILKEGFM